VTHPKFCQIAVTHDPATGDSVYALDEKGEVYLFMGDAWEVLDEVAAAEEEEEK
jgi:hypothetical protein